MTIIEEFMMVALDEARQSLREGNHGFGAVILRDDKIVAKAHDREESDQDPTSHAEMNVIRQASSLLGKNLRGCLLISTHEPCPMCATAVIWSGIDHLVYGYSIQASIDQGRNRLDIGCEELFRRSGKAIRVDKDVLADQCAILYRQDVRQEIKRLRNADCEQLQQYNRESAQRRMKWFQENRSSFGFMESDPIKSAYRLLLERFGIEESEAPIVEQSAGRIVFHSMNFCPTLEACRILGYDTRYVCRHYNENSTDQLIKKIDPRLRFSRNYDKLRPYSLYCEEMISMDNK